MMRKYILYLIRWQLSTPILAACVWWLTEHLGATLTTIIANLVGGLIFFWFDRWLFSRSIILQGELWEINYKTLCADCGLHGIGRRLVKRKDYDRMNDKNPEFRCKICSKIKLKSTTN